MKRKNKLFFLNVFANSKTSTAVVNSGDNVKFTDGVRAVYSKEIEFKALPVMRFFQFAEVRTELGVEPGLTINMLTYDNLKLGGALTEMTPMKTQNLSGSVKQITVSEYGNAVSVSELLVQTSFDDIMASATTLLGRDYALVLDCELRDTACKGTNRVYGRLANGNKVAQRVDVTAECKLRVSSIKDAVEILSTNNAPKAMGGSNWIAIVHPHCSRDLRDDPAWINASQYAQPDTLLQGEVGRVDDVRFIETSLMPNGASADTDPSYKADLKKNTANNKVDIYQTVVFGDAYFGVAFALPVELRDNGVEDFGRKRSLAWYSIFGVGLLHDAYGVVIETC